MKRIIFALAAFTACANLWAMQGRVFEEKAPDVMQEINWEKIELQAANHVVECVKNANDGCTAIEYLFTLGHYDLAKRAALRGLLDEQNWATDVISLLDLIRECRVNDCERVLDCLDQALSSDSPGEDYVANMDEPTWRQIELKAAEHLVACIKHAHDACAAAKCLYDLGHANLAQRSAIYGLGLPNNTCTHAIQLSKLIRKYAQIESLP